MEKEFNLEESWEALNTNTKSNHQLNKEVIMKSINQKSNLTSAQIKRKLAKELKGHGIGFIILMYFCISGIIHNQSHNPDQNLFTLFTVLSIFVFICYTVYLIVQLSKFRKIKTTELTDLNCLNQLKNNYDLIKSSLRFERLWLVIFNAIGSYLFFTHYLHSADHQSGAGLIVSITLIIISLSLLYIERKHRVKYRDQLKTLKLNIKEFSF